MNIIIIILDSLRQDHVSVYGKGQIFDNVKLSSTPNIDEFARESIIFDNAYPMGLPTIPVRTELMTGQATLPFKPWAPLSPSEKTVAEILTQEGYINGLISDIYHYRAPEMNFHRGYHSYQWIRGQEYDPWISSPPERDIKDYINKKYDAIWRERIQQFLSNTDEFKKEDDCFSAKVMKFACEWLEKNRIHKNIFLWIDSFDPHEPWDPPKKFDTYTDPNYKGNRLIMPMGGFATDWASLEEIRYIQALYAGEVSSVDYWLGLLFKKLKELGYYDDSVIVLLSDHGHPLADHGKFLKGTDRMYSELLKVPFIIRLPKGKGSRRTPAIVQFPDLLPTLLELIGYGNCCSAMHGKSFCSVLSGKNDTHRDAVITGFFGGQDRCIRNNRWSCIERPGDQPDELYDLKSDPRERNNVIDKYHDEAVLLAGKFSNYFRDKPINEIKGLQGKYEMTSGSVE